MSYYTGRIKVVGADLLCFPVDKNTLEPLSCGCYDAYAWTDPDKDALETITTDDWLSRRNNEDVVEDLWV